MVAERFTSRRGVRIRYLDNAPETPVGLPIVLSPGVTDVAEEYAEVLASFLPRRMLVVEVRGRGGSESPPTGYTAADHCDDLRAVVDEEGIDRFHLMTFSRGTTWGLDLVLESPERCATVSIGDYWAAEKSLAGDDGLIDGFLAGRYRSSHSGHLTIRRADSAILRKTPPHREPDPGLSVQVPPSESSSRPPCHRRGP